MVKGTVSGHVPAAGAMTPLSVLAPLWCRKVRVPGSAAQLECRGGQRVRDQVVGPMVLVRGPC
jgi:hypothetical protein